MKEKIKNFIHHKRFKYTIIGVLFLVAIVLINYLYVSYAYFYHETSGSAIDSTASVSTNDLELFLYRQNRDSSGNAIANSYTRVYFVPRDNYTYNSAKTECSDGLSITYHSISQDGVTFEFFASKKGYCKVYFDASGTYAESYTVDIYYRKNSSSPYKPVGAVPGSVTLDSYSCTNGGTISLAYETLTSAVPVISFLGTKDDHCDVYLTIQPAIEFIKTLVNKTSSQTDWKVVNEGNAGYRYIGANDVGVGIPNYVSYSGKVFRILGYVPSSTGKIDVDGIKIIANTAYSTSEYYSGSNSWSTTTLYNNMKNYYDLSLAQSFKEPSASSFSWLTSNLGANTYISYDYNGTNRVMVSLPTLTDVLASNNIQTNADANSFVTTWLSSLANYSNDYFLYSSRSASTTYYAYWLQQHLTATIDVTTLPSSATTFESHATMILKPEVYFTHGDGFSTSAAYYTLGIEL